MEICKKTGGVMLSAILDTPIGQLRLAACEQGIHNIQLPHHLSKVQNFKPNTGASLEPVYLFYDDVDGGHKSKATQNHLNNCVSWLLTYFKKPELIQAQEIPKICLSNCTEFESQVWTTLMSTTGYGKTTSYAKLANEVNHPNAARAVGTAMKKNPVVLLVPCHRVIRSDGTLGKYSGGYWNEVKEYLINHEKGVNT